MISLRMDYLVQTDSCENQIVLLFLNLTGESAVCFLKKLEKCGVSSNPRLWAISDMFQCVCNKRIFASCETLSAMMVLVDFPVISFNALFRWLT